MVNIVALRKDKYLFLDGERKMVLHIYSVSDIHGIPMDSVIKKIIDLKLYKNLDEIIIKTTYMPSGYYGKAYVEKLGNGKKIGVIKLKDSPYTTLSDYEKTIYHELYHLYISSTGRSKLFEELRAIFYENKEYLKRVSSKILSNLSLKIRGYLISVSRHVESPEMSEESSSSYTVLQDL